MKTSMSIDFKIISISRIERADYKSGVKDARP